ncbi:helix-turn-helix domain-containing protein [Epidermidibacterium keratini]|uniref:Helix-turn-helix domain-containing protein n=1 Tax=Epidermidibacterium keratini TaxID=1891644 RepID=A0A7L4YKC7_9ACTN|nr:AraC family transcriptional regulator [Epidermidibacterium keratini]QHB99710.1 helix-turn-helix domain-containing protein [Epidermidibacterium keratini]
MPEGSAIRAWRPTIDGVHEVLHARFTDHAYPAHAHDVWTVLIVDDGVIGYDLDRHDHAALPQQVTILPPHVAHDGASVTSGGFTKRVLYVDDRILPPQWAGRAVDTPALADRDLRRLIARTHTAIENHDDLEAQSRLALMRDRIGSHLTGAAPRETDQAGAVRRIRDELERHLLDPTPLSQIAGSVGLSEGHLIRTFTRHVGLPPHQYVIGRRIEQARGLLLSGVPAADVAAATGFHDQAHLTRHFKRMLSVTPAAYARRT